MEVVELWKNGDIACGDGQVSLSGVLFERLHVPFLAERKSDWHSGRCVRLMDEGIFDALFTNLFAHVLGGGDTLFFHKATVTGRLCASKEGHFEMRDVTAITVDVEDERISIPFQSEKSPNPSGGPST